MSGESLLGETGNEGEFEKWYGCAEGVGKVRSPSGET